MERRPDCPEFDFKEYPHQCGDCQTDGHYLCGNCKHIASFEHMEIGDNAERYYPARYKEEILEQKKQFNSNMEMLRQRAERLRRMSFNK